MKFSIIGCGLIGTKRAKALQGHEIVFIYDPNREMTKKLSQGVQVGGIANSLEEAIVHPEVEAVIVATPNYLLSEISMKSLQASKHVLVEKPLCARYVESAELIRRAKTYKKTFYVAFNNQFREDNQWLKSTALSGEIGDLELLDFEWCRTKRYVTKTWLYDPRQSGGGVLIDLGAHMVHLALSLVPDRSSYVVSCKNFKHNERLSGVEDTSISMITVNDSVSIVIKLGWDMCLPTDSKVNLNVFGRKGTISNRDFQDEKSDGYAYMIQDFFRHVENRAVPDLGLVYDTMALLDALYESDNSQSLVTGRFKSRNLDQ